jgi:hypothetical protein
MLMAISSLVQTLLIGGHMTVVNVAAILRNIVGFADGDNQRIENRHNDVWHWFKHCFGKHADLHHVMTLAEYLRIGKEIGTRAAQNSPGTYVKLRDNNEVLVYWEPEPGQQGIFMVVRPIGVGSGEIKTLFSPDDMKRYYDLQPPIEPTLH